MNVVVSYLVVLARAVLLGRYLVLGGRHIAVLLGVSEGLALVSTLVALTRGVVDRSRLGLLVPFAYLAPLLFNPINVVLWGPLYLWLVCCAVQVLMRLHMGFSLTVGVPCFTDVVKVGPYSHLRHPLSFCEAVQCVLYGLAFCSPWNLSVSVFAVMSFVVAVLVEESFLRGFPPYVVYCRSVPWRWLPGVW